MAQDKPIVESVREFMLTCPYIEGGQIHVDDLPEGAAYSINTMRGEPVYKRYTDGTVLKQFWFEITFVTAHGTGTDGETAGSRFCQYLDEWFERQNQKELLPVLEMHTPVRIETVNGAKMSENKTGYADYQMQCRLIYF